MGSKLLLFFVISLFSMRVEASSQKRSASRIFFKYARKARQFGIKNSDRIVYGTYISLMTGLSAWAARELLLEDLRKHRRNCKGSAV